MPEAENRLTRKDMLGYALGDFGGCMTFAIMGSFLTPYYNEVAGLSMAAVSGILLVLRVWDGLSSPMMGVLMDKAFACSGGRGGKFRPWMRRAAPLLLLSSILMYTLPGYVSGPGKAAAAFFTYLLYETSYTMYSIPYGSLLSAMAGTDAERASLSSARGFGATIGNLIPLALFPLILSKAAASLQLAYGIGVLLCAGLGFVACLLSSCWTRERLVAAEPENSDVSWTDIFVSLRVNRPFAAVCLMGLLFCVNQYMVSTLSIYMFRDVLGALPMMSVMTVLTMGGSAVTLSLAPKIVGRFGLQSTVCTGQMIGIAVMGIDFLCLVVHRNVWLYIVLTVAGNCLTSLTALMQWGMVGEVIDYNERLTGKRTEGSIYGTFNLMRRVGQAIGASAAVLLLGMVGYIPGAPVQSGSAVLGIEALAVLLPAVFVLLCWVVLRYLWHMPTELRSQAGENRQDAD